ncbi:MAG: amidohydrolase family protein, partial [Comamonas sp.]
RLWWLHTGGAARALGLEGVIGTLATGSEADFVVLNPDAIPLLSRKARRAENLEELLFALIVLGDDRAVERVVTA